MEIEKQVCSSALAQKLKELGVEQNSYFHWYGGNVLRANQLTQELRRHGPPCSAFTVAELGRLILSDMDADLPFFFAENDVWRFQTIDRFVDSDTEADARAKMLIFFTEKGLMES